MVAFFVEGKFMGFRRVRWLFFCFLCGGHAEGGMILAMCNGVMV